MHEDVVIKTMNKLIAITVVMILALPVFALADGPKKEAEKNEEKPKIILDTVVISATRTETSAFEAPASVSVVDDEEIEREQATTIKDILENVPNVDFASGTSTYFQVPSIRGLEDEQTIIKIDGARQQYNDNAGNARNPITMDPYLLKQVEVVRGPSSTLHGSGGIGGVIAMRTKDAWDFLKNGEKYGATIKAGYQSVDSQKWQSSSGYAGTDRFGLVTNITTRDFGHMRTSSPEEEDELVRRTGHSTTHFLKGSYKPTDGQYLSLSVHKFRDMYSITGGSMYHSKQTQVSTNYELNPKDNNWLDLRAAGQYTWRFNKSYLSDIGNKIDDTMYSWGGDVQNTCRFGAKDTFYHTLTVGTDYYINEQKGHRNGASDASRPKAKGFDFGLFMQDNISLPYGFSLIPALRYTKYHREEKSGEWEDQDKAQITPKVTANWQALDWLNLFVTYAESFRPPSLNEIYYYMPVPGIGAVKPNPNLKPEKGKTWEYGVSMTFDNVFGENDPLRFKAVYFRERIKDFQNAALIDNSTPGNWVWSTINEGSVRRFGYEAELHYSYDRYSASLTYGKVMGREEDSGDRVGQTPAQYGLRLCCDIPEYDLGLTWKSNYVAQSKGYQPWNSTTETVPSYHIHGFAVTWTPKDIMGYDGLRVELGVDNLLDKKYITYRGAWDRGRNVKLGFSCSF